MLDAGVGLLRTLPAPDDGLVARFRRQAQALGVRVARGRCRSDRSLRGLRRDEPATSWP